MSTPRETRSTARQRQHSLQVPNFGLGRADLIRSRSPSPSAPGTFAFPPPTKKSSEEVQEEQFQDALSFNSTMATPEQLAVIREQLRNELRAEVRNELRTETAAAAAAIPDAVRKKPEIPPFDKAHIDIWIKRTENSFIRANIRTVSEKFAFLETKFPVGLDPRIDEFLYGNATEATWADFKAYLKKEYGATVQQQASIIIDGFKREGRRPSQYAAALNDKTKDVTMDDVKKEMLLREIPADVRRMLQERIEGLSFKDTAKIADNYFDSEGRPKHTTQNPSVNQVTRAVNEVSISHSYDTTDDEDPEVSAVSFRKKRPEKRPTFSAQKNRNPSQPAPQPQSRGTSSQQLRNGQSHGPPTSRQAKLCRYHELFGDEAKTCKQGCPRFPKIPSNGKAGRQT